MIIIFNTVAVWVHHCLRYVIITVITISKLSKTVTTNQKLDKPNRLVINNI